MTNETIFPDEQDSDLNVTPSIPAITPKPGWQTSQGQMTGIFTLACLVLSFFGFHYTPEQFDTWANALNHIIEIVLPLITAAGALITYTTSRGKTYSNAINATAHVQASVFSTPEAIQGQPLEAVGLMGGGIFNNIIGGRDWKDPERYERLLRVATAVGVPGAAQASAVDQKIHPVDLINGIFDLLHKGKKK